jgi:hypothetical protein
MTSRSSPLLERSVSSATETERTIHGVTEDPNAERFVEETETYRSP